MDTVATLITFVVIFAIIYALFMYQYMSVQGMCKWTSGGKLDFAWKHALNASTGGLLGLSKYFEKKSDLVKY